MSEWETSKERHIDETPSIEAHEQTLCGSNCMCACHEIRPERDLTEHWMDETYFRMDPQDHPAT